MGIDIVILLLLSSQAMVPIALTAIGEVFAEKSGVVNIGLEGILLLSAFGAVVGGEFFVDLSNGNGFMLTLAPWLGMLSGVLMGLFIGLIHGLIGIYWKGDQIVSGVGINIFALGVVGFGIPAIWNVKGQHQVDSLAVFQGLQTSWGKFSYVIPVVLLAAVFTYWMMHKTAFGLRVKAVGENPEAADIAGISVNKTRLLAVLYGSALGGLAGAYMSLDWTTSITKNLPAGRGFIALATVVFSKLNPLLALLGAAVFGFFDVLSTWISTIPAINQVVPFYFVRMIPYVATLIVVAGAIGRARFPKATAQPYRRE